MPDDSLLYLARAPAFVERAVRGAFAEMVTARQLGGATCDVRSFAQLALLCARAIVTADRSDVLALHEREAAVVRAATSFAASALGRRMRAIPIGRLVAAPVGVDAAVHDRHRALHYVRLETFPGAQARIEAVARAFRAMDRAALPTHASLHFFSLRDGLLRSYPPLPTRKADVPPRRDVAAA